MSKGRFMYLNFNQRRVGFVAMTVDRQAGQVHYAVSCLHDSDKFDRDVAQSLSTHRLAMGEGVRTVSLPHNANGHEISMAVMKNMVRNSLAPTKLRKAATQWLNRPQQ